VINSDSTPRLVSFHEDLAPSPRAAERPLSIIERLAAQTLGERLQVGVAQAAGYVRSRVMTWSRRAVVNVIGAMGASPGSESDYLCVPKTPPLLIRYTQLFPILLTRTAPIHRAARVWF
jgi:hypothetical protein